MAKKEYKFIIRNNGDIVLRTNSPETAAKKVIAIKSSGTISCSIRNNIDNTITVYSKDEHQKNYQVTVNKLDIV